MQDTKLKPTKRQMHVGLGGISSLYDMSIYFYKRYGMKQYR